MIVEEPELGEEAAVLPHLWSAGPGAGSESSIYQT